MGSEKWLDWLTLGVFIVIVIGFVIQSMESSNQREYFEKVQENAVRCKSLAGEFSYDTNKCFVDGAEK